MYEVFIDNKLIVFCEFHRNIKKYSKFVEIQTNNLFEIDVIALRNSLPQSIVVIIISKQIAIDFDFVFRDYQKIETAGGLVQRKNDFLFIERNGLWDLPKGKVEKNETIEQAAIREIEEECGIEKPVINYLMGYTFHTYEYKGIPVLKKNWWFLLNYSGTKKVTPQKEEGISQVIWLQKKQWEKVMENTYPSIVQVLSMAKKKLGMKKFG